MAIKRTPSLPLLAVCMFSELCHAQGQQSGDLATVHREGQQPMEYVPP